MKKTLLAALVLASSFSHAQDHSISKSLAPDIVNVRLIGTGMANFGIRFSDLPRGAFGTAMTIEKLDWSTTHYTKEGITETVNICYYPYGPSSKKDETCEKITPNSFGTVEAFSGLRFGYESRVIIRHNLTGETQTVHPAGRDSITLHYRR